MNVLIQNANNKFIKNISETKLSDYKIYNYSINNNLYELHYTLNINSVFFTASIMTSEIQQYISEFFQDVEIFIYHDNINISNELISLYGSSCKHIMSNVKKEIASTNIINLPTLVNIDLYHFNPNNIILIEKVNQIICFLDNAHSIPESLKNILYPNTNMKIKLFNNINIKHIQNLGLLSEKDKAKILHQSEYFLTLDGEYVTEAMLSGCKVLSLEDLPDLKIKYTKLPEYSSYESFLISIL